MAEMMQVVTIQLRGGQILNTAFPVPEQEGTMNPQIAAFCRAVTDKKNDDAWFEFKGAIPNFVRIADVSGFQVRNMDITKA